MRFAVVSENSFKIALEAIVSRRDDGSFRVFRILIRESHGMLKSTVSYERNGDHPSLDDEPIALEAAPAIDQDRIRRAVREILLAVGENPDREGLLETPDRVARMYAEIFQGLHQNPRVHLRKTFTQKYDEIVIVKDIQFSSFCEHHLLPFGGRAHVAYLPNGKVIGLSKMARVIEVFARRPQVQEQLTEQVAELLMEELDARGVAVVIEASHSCMTVRGVNKPNSMCVTSAMRGVFRSNPASRAEALALLNGSRSC